MRRALVICLLAGCQQVLGLDRPRVVDAPGPDDGDVVDTSHDGAMLAGCTTTDPTLVACFDFEDNIMDHAPSPNSVIGSSVSYVPGVLGKAVELGTASRVTVNDSVQLDLGAATIEAWVYLTQTPATGARFGVWDTDGQYAMFLKDSGASVTCIGGSATVESGALAPNRWTHVACTFAGKVSAWVDGQLASSTGTGTPLATSPTTGAEIGGNAPDGTDRFIGRMDSVRLYSVARTASQICTDASCGP